MNVKSVMLRQAQWLGIIFRISDVNMVENRSV